MQKGKQTLKRLLSFVMALAMVLTLLPAAVFAADADALVYLKPNSNWLADNARFAVYYWNDGGSYWLDMTDADGDGYYEATVPAGYSNIIFCRMDPGSADNSWNTKWNQTSDLTVPTDGTNCYTVADGTWDKGGGAWSVYAPTGSGGEEDDTITVYFRNDWLWPEVYVHYWNDSQGTTWPGEKMTFVETLAEGDLYTAEIPAWATGIIFNGLENGSTTNRQQTPDVTGFADGDAYYIHWDGENKCSKFSYTPSSGGDTDPSEPEEAAAKYYLAGYINGSDYYGTNYPFDESGKLTTLVSADSYVLIQDSAGKQYMTSGWLGTEVTGATLYESSTLTNADKLFVPAGSATFTLVENEDGSLALSYTLEEVEIETTECEITLHFVNSKDWSTVYLYSWISSTLLGGWPGTKCDMDADGFYSMTYVADVPVGSGVNFIFSNGSGSQTVDLSLSASDVATGSVEKWVQISGESDGKFTCDILDAVEAVVTSPVVDGTSVAFEYKDAAASSVEVRGSWDDWASGVAMTVNGYGVWTAAIDELAPGSYEYKFYVNGSEWVSDPCNPPAVSGGNSTFQVLDPNAEDKNEITINLHYTRPDGDYEGWNMYIWTDSGTIKADSEVIDGVLVTTIVIPGRGIQAVNFIPRLSVEGNEWKSQEATFVVNLSEIVSGTIDYYVTAGSASGTMSLNLDVVKANKLASVELDYDSGEIVIAATKLITEDTLEAFTVVNTETGEAVAIDYVTDTGTTYTIGLTEALDLVKLYQYKVVFEGFEYAININTVYASEKFAAEYTYTGDDLGATWSADSTKFVVWAPTAEAVSVNLYESGTAGTNDRLSAVSMTRGNNGEWTATVEGDLNGTYYTYAVTVDGETVEAVDPYARTTGVNGNRGMVIDLDSTDPAGWDSDSNPNKIDSYTDAVIYELHVRDFSIDDSSGVSEANRGKYLAFTETGTTTAEGVSTGIDYLKELGVTHLHLLPVYDYASVDETTCSNFNWGYDPQNYNTPEGSYSTDPYNGEVRVTEFKQMVGSLHDAGISVIMDVVYNHVYDADTFCFNNIVPGYFSRYQSNGSGCGNDTASEREMVSKYIVESVMYWKEEYHIDGFRFDLVGLLDTETINAIVDTVHAKYPDVIFYGEGWTLGTNVEEGYSMATQANSALTPDFAYFSDTIRNLLAGDNSAANLGYVSGAAGQESAIVSNFMAQPGWSSSPTQIVQYASCHDNYTLMDKLILSTGADGVTGDVISMNNLTAAIYMTSQGIPFIHAGEEFLREKLNADGSRNHNSYNSSDEVNHIEWSNLEQDAYADTSAYYQGLIAFRKAHAALRYDTAAEVRANVRSKLASGNVVAFQIDGNAAGDDDIYVIFNANSSAQTVALPEGTWTININKADAGTASLGTAEGSVSVEGISAMVLTKEDEGADEGGNTGSGDTVTLYYDNSSSNWSTVYAYTWTDSTQQLGSWPGTVMTEGEDGIWSIEIPADAVNIIFNSGSGSQTSDLKVPTDGANLYDGSAWTVRGAEVYYLFGYINGANYGCEEDYESMGEYKFVNGKLTAAFESDSYVAVKTKDNEKWYMTDGWLGNVTEATLYTTDITGENSNKLFVPGGILLTFTLAENEDGSLTLSYEIGEEIETGSADDYYLFGYINGANYGCEDDYYTLGDYKFVDGKVTATFETDSYVAVKTGDNGSWYMTDGWLGSVTSATLYDTAVYTDFAKYDKLMVPGGVELTFTLTVNDDDTVTLSYTTDTGSGAADTSGIQDGVTLHCWNWSFAEIEANMARIAAQGYTAIQTSPVQPIKEATDSSAVGSHWWVYYQPVDFVITTDEGNALGTGEELVSMIRTAHEYGIKVIVDVVANHLANETGNNLSPEIPEYLLDDAYWHDITINTSDYSNRYEVTQYCMGGLPDLNTANDDIQGYVLDFLKECIDAGVDGFRFDAAKHIETPDDDSSFASDFWPTVIGGAEDYAETAYGKDIYMYGEVLDSINGLPISAYTKYMSITDNSWGNTLRGSIAGGNAAMSDGYDKMVDASRLVIWAESHDTYADGSSSGVSEADINKTWALVAARADAMGLYLARPASTEQLLGVASVTAWANEEVKAVNAFHNAFVGEDEIVSNENGVSYVERGTSGVVLVNAAGTAAQVSVTANAMADGTYTDQLSGNTFTVADGKISGTIGDTGIAVVYNTAEEAGTITKKGNSLSLEGLIYINHYVLFHDFSERIDQAYIEANGGLLVWNTAVSEAEAVFGHADADVNAGLVSSSLGYMGRTDGIAVAEYADELYLRAYLKLSDGTYVYGPLDTYSVQDYCESRLAKSANEKLKNTCAALLHFGAAAQVYFEYNTGDLANAGILESWPVEAFDSNLLTAADAVNTGIAASGSIGVVGKSLSLEDAILVNYYFRPGFTPAGAELLFWEGVEGELTENNVSYTADLEYVTSYDGSYHAQSDPIASAKYDTTVFCCAKFTDDNGDVHYSEVIAYSPEVYAANMLSSSDANLVAMVQQMVIYGEYAKAYFG